jgi:CRP-like cAMP-binding protein
MCAVNSGEAFPSKKPAERSWWGYQHVADGNGGPSARQSGGEKVLCDYAVAAKSGVVELLYLALPDYNEVVYPTQDLGYSTERCRTILKQAPNVSSEITPCTSPSLSLSPLPPQLRKQADTNYFLHTVMKPHAFFQQMTTSARLTIAQNLTIGFVEEGSVLVDLDERASACYILLSGSAKIVADGAGAQRDRNAELDFSPSSSPIITKNRVLDARVLEKLEPGDIFGVEMMVQKGKGSNLLVKVTEASEFIVIPSGLYRLAMGERDMMDETADLTASGLSAQLSSTSLAGLISSGQCAGLESFRPFR